MVLIAEGTRLAIQFVQPAFFIQRRLTLIRNMTWEGKKGFQSPIDNETFHVKDFGVYGNAHEERGLTCGSIVLRLNEQYLASIFSLDVEFYFSGHMTPRTYPLLPNSSHVSEIVWYRSCPLGRVPGCSISCWSRTFGFSVISRPNLWVIVTIFCLYLCANLKAI